MRMCAAAHLSRDSVKSIWHWENSLLVQQFDLLINKTHKTNPVLEQGKSGAYVHPVTFSHHRGDGVVQASLQLPFDESVVPVKGHHKPLQHWGHLWREKTKKERRGENMSIIGCRGNFTTPPIANGPSLNAGMSHRWHQTAVTVSQTQLQHETQPLWNYRRLNILEPIHFLSDWFDWPCMANNCHT